MAHDIDLTADLNGQDDDGLGWSTLADARDPSRVRPGAMLLGGNRYGQAVVRIVAVDGDGQIDVVDLAWLGGQDRHLLNRTVTQRRSARISLRERRSRRPRESESNAESNGPG